MYSLKLLSICQRC